MPLSYTARVVTFSLGLLCAASILSSCASSSSKDGLTALDVSERSSANYGTTDNNRERESDTSKLDILRYKTSF